MKDTERTAAGQWEQAVLQALEGILVRARGTPEELRVDGLALDGSYPDTRVVATMRSRGGQAASRAYRLWDSPLEGPDGGRTTPEDAAVLIHTWLHGG